MEYFLPNVGSRPRRIEEGPGFVRGCKPGTNLECISYTAELVPLHSLNQSLRDADAMPNASRLNRHATNSGLAVTGTLLVNCRATPEKETQQGRKEGTIQIRRCL